MQNTSDSGSQQYRDDDEDSKMPLIHRAAQRGDVAKVAEILAANPCLADTVAPETVSGRDAPLHLAAWQGHEHVAEVLLKHGANVNARGDGEKTPLHYAAVHGSVAVAELLIKHGADLEAKQDDGQTPLQLASIGRYDPEKQVAKLLLRSGVKLDFLSAIGLDRADIVRQMVKDDPQLVKKYPNTAVGGAVSLCAHKMYMGLPSRDKTKEEILEIAKRAMAENGDILDMVLAQGPPKPIDFHTFFAAIQLPSTDLVERLLKFGVEIQDKKLKHQLDLLDTARRTSAAGEEMVALLKRYGIKRPPPPPDDVLPDLSDLIANLKNDDPKLRWMAATFLGNYGQLARKAIPALTEATKDANPGVAAAARKALKLIEPDKAEKGSP